MVRAGFPGRMGPIGPVAGYTAEASALFAAMTTPPTDARKALIDATITALKASGAWATYDTLYVKAAADSQAARLNWKDPSTFTLTEVNSPLFTADRGYTGNGTTSYLATGYNPGDGGTYKWLQNDAAFGSWCLTSDTGSAGKSSTGATAGNGTDMKEFSTSSFMEARVNASGTITTTPTTVPNSLGHAVASRSNSATFGIYKNGAGVQTAIASTSTAVVNQQFFICGRSTNGSFAQASNRQYSVVHHGGGLTLAQVTASYNAFLTYLQGVGAA